jgi:hypothetical protein
MCHNGIIHGYGDKKTDISDSAFLAKMLYPCRTRDQYLAVLDHHTVGSRFVVMTSKFSLMAGLFVKDNRVFYSNETYKPFTPITYDELGWYGSVYAGKQYAPVTLSKFAGETNTGNDKITAQWRHEYDDLQMEKQHHRLLNSDWKQYQNTQQKINDVDREKFNQYLDGELYD